MAIVIKEIQVKATISGSKSQSILTEDDIRKLKQDILKEVQRSQKIKNRWSKER